MLHRPIERTPNWFPRNKVSEKPGTVRSGEVRGARWDEMDTQARVWAVPVARMKMKRDHRVPLCGRAMGDPDAAQTLGDDAGPLDVSSATTAANLRSCVSRPSRAAACLPIQGEADFALWYSLAEVISDQRIRRY